MASFLKICVLAAVTLLIAVAVPLHAQPAGSSSGLLELGPGPFFWALPGAAHERGHVLGPVQRRDRDYYPSRRRERASPAGSELRGRKHRYGE